MQLHRYVLFLFILLFGAQWTLAQDPFATPVALTGSDANPNQAVVMGDYDNDGWIEFYITRGNDSTGAQFANYLYDNSGGTFSLVTIAGVTDKVDASGSASWADIDNDGDLDLYVGAAEAGFGAGKPNNYLFINDGAGSFTDATGSATYGAITTDNEDSRHVGFGDYNNDGYPDVFVDNGNISLFGQTKGNNSFYANDGDGTYTRKTEAELGYIVYEGSDQSLSQYRTFGSGFGWSDFDNDGYLDIFNFGGGGAAANILWENNPGSGNFLEVTPGEMQPTQTSFISGSWGDYDNDGDMDLYACNMVDGSVHRNYLFRNNSTTSTVAFDSVTNAGPNVTDAYESMSSAWGDYDNDGDLDLFVSNTNDNGQNNIPATLYQNTGATGGYTFTKVKDYTQGNNYSGRGVAWGDLDNDGDIDLISCRWGNPLYYENTLNNGNSFAIIKLRGTGTTNRHGMGSRVKLTANIPEQGTTVTQMREISGQTGGGAQNSLRAHFGVGTATQISEIRAEWLNSSGSGTRTVNSYSDMPTGKIFIFTEGTTTGTADVIASQTFMYLIGSSGGSVEMATASTTAGTLTITRSDSDPGSSGFSGSATAPDASTVTPNTVSPDKYWTMSESGLTAYGARVYIDISGIAGVSNPDRLVIVQRANSGSAWTPLNTSRIGNTLYTTGTVSSLGEFGIGSNTADNSLPVELASFTAGAGDQMVELKWSTASELENAGFIIERAEEGSDLFMEIASYKTDNGLRGRISSNSLTEYAYTDRGVENGRTYRYRLSDESIAGVRTQLAVREAKPMVTISDFRLRPNYPNPFNPSTTITFDVPVNAGDARVDLTVFNSLGERIRVLYRGTLNPGSHRFEWNGTNRFGEQQASGVYILRASVGNRYVQTIKMLLVK